MTYFAGGGAGGAVRGAGYLSKKLKKEADQGGNGKPTSGTNDDALPETAIEGGQPIPSVGGE